MAEKDMVIKEKVESSGLFNFSSFYSFAHTWFRDENYGVMEERYIEKVSGSSRDLLIEWVATKFLSDYFKIEQKIKFEVKGLTEVEVEIDGQRKKMNKGSVMVEVKGTLVMDHLSKWDINPTYKFMRSIYNKYIIPTRIDNMQDKVRGDVRDFKEQLKAFLELSGKR